MSELLALGISHKTAPVALRERLAFTEREASEFATAGHGQRRGPRGGRDLDLQPHRGLPRRRRTPWTSKPRPTCSGLLARRAGIRPTELAQEIYSPRNCDAARQLYRVTAGLESMIVGEAEIQGQVSRAHEAAMRAGSTGALSNRLFAAALTTGKRVRTETAIGCRRRVSVPSVAVDLALSVLGDLAERHVVILGAGETSELTARALAEQGAGTIFVANRHADRALSLAQRFGGSVVGLDELPEQLLHADIVLSSTSSPHPIVGREELELVMAERGRAGPLLLDRHRGAARHRRRLRRARRRDAVRHRRPAGRRRAQPRHARERDPARGGDRRGGDPALRALARPARGAAHRERAARARQRDRRAGARRERRALGGGLRRATSPASRRSRAR